MNEKINNIFSSDGLFVKYKYIDFELEELQILFDSNRKEKYTLDIFCPICNKESVFSPIADDNCMFQQSHTNSLLKGASPFNPRVNNIKDGEHWLTSLNIITREFSCSRSTNNQHNYIVVFKFFNDYFIKVAQYPSVADLTNIPLRKYKKLSNEIFLELSKGTGLHSHGIGVGSFVYLRRIIENHIVKPRLEILITEGKLSKEELMQKDFKQKLKLLRGEISDFLVSNQVIYSILSKGIHELSEEECRTHFPILKTCIELILDEQIELNEKAKKRNQLTNELQKLKN